MVCETFRWGEGGRARGRARAEGRPLLASMDADPQTVAIGTHMVKGRERIREKVVMRWKHPGAAIGEPCLLTNIVAKIDGKWEGKGGSKLFVPEGNGTGN